MQMACSIVQVPNFNGSKEFDRKNLKEFEKIRICADSFI
jgi:hypothetical protein